MTTWNKKYAVVAIDECGDEIYIDRMIPKKEADNKATEAAAFYPEFRRFWVEWDPRDRAEYEIQLGSWLED